MKLFLHWPNRAIQPHSFSLAFFTDEVKAFGRTTRKLQSGFNSRPIRAMCWRRATSVLCIVTDKGVPQDYVKAHMWFNLASVGAPAKDRPDFVGYRDELATKMTPAQIAEAQNLARDWKPNK